LQLLSRKCPVPLNLEMAATAEMVAFARKYKPAWVCLVPEKRAELTTEGGLNVAKGLRAMAPMVEKMQMRGIEISMFIEPSIDQVIASHNVGADAVEFHTGHWVTLTGAKKAKEWKRLVAAAELANAYVVVVPATEEQLAAEAARQKLAQTLAEADQRVGTLKFEMGPPPRNMTRGRGSALGFGQ
ncbi:MAG: hypothetical protein EOP21_08290, partial [Hyphomicrobiales bacterium]